MLSIGLRWWARSRGRSGLVVGWGDGGSGRPVAQMNDVAEEGTVVEGL